MAGRATAAARRRFEQALQQNEIVDLFYDDWKMLAMGDAGLGSKGDSHLKEYQSFTYTFSKNKTVTWVDWHPTIKGTYWGLLLLNTGVPVVIVRQPPRP